jgi:hypothetical protein
MRWNPKDHLFKNIKRQILRLYQYNGIKSATNVLMEFTNPAYEAMFSKIVLNRQYITIPFIYKPEFNIESIEKLYIKSLYYQFFKNIRESNELVIFSHGRHEWTEDNNTLVTRSKHTKGNHKLIYGFAEFLVANRNVNAHLVLFEYGEDVQRSKDLINKLEIEQYVSWLPLMPRKEIMVGISLCDIGVGELDSSYFSYGAIFEFMAMAKPIIHYRDDSLYESRKNNMYPMFNANSSAQVNNHLSAYRANPAKFRAVGQQAHKWFIDEAINKPINIICKLIDEKIAN